MKSSLRKAPKIVKNRVHFNDLVLRRDIRAGVISETHIDIKEKDKDKLTGTPVIINNSPTLQRRRKKKSTGVTSDINFQSANPIVSVPTSSSTDISNFLNPDLVTVSNSKNNVYRNYNDWTTPGVSLYQY